jgi:hypothetical protein
MDCRTARLLLDLAHPSAAELDAAEAEALRRHLTACPTCEALADSERRFEEQVGSAVRNVPVPEGLSARLRECLQTERRNWYVRRLRFAAVATAAVVALGVWLGTIWRNRNWPEPDVYTLREQVASVNQRSAKQVEEWFREQYGLEITAPPDFNYALLTHYDLANCQGKRVPLLLFTRLQLEDGPPRVAKARVYILSSRQFDLKKFTGEALSESNSLGYTVKVQRPADRPDLAYVIIHTGDARELEGFLIQKSPGPPA